MTFRLLVLSALSSLVLCGQPALGPPAVGFVRDPSGAVRPVLGVRANFLLGLPVVERALSAAFSGRAGLVKTEAEILVLDEAGQVIETGPAPPGTAEFAFDQNGRPSSMFFSVTGELFARAGLAWRRVPSEAGPGGENVVAVGPQERGSVSMLVRGGDELWLRRLSVRTGAVLHSRLLPGILEPALLLPRETVVYAAEGGLAIRRAGGEETFVDLPFQADRLELMGDSRVHFVAEGGARDLLIHLGDDGPSWHELPGVVP